MNEAWLSIPVVFIVMLAACALLLFLMSRLAVKSRPGNGGKKAYACGEVFEGHMIQPDYSQFFPFAFFFTILHVATLVIATVPKENPGIFAIAAVYVVGIVAGLVVLAKR